MGTTSSSLLRYRHNARRLVELMLRSSRAALARVDRAAAVAECYGVSANRITIRLDLLEDKYGLRPRDWALPLELGQMRGTNAAAAPA